MHPSKTILAALAIACLQCTAAEGDFVAGFGDEGVAMLESGDAFDARGTPIHVMDDHRIVTCTSGISSDGLRFTDFIVRLDADGSKDETFGSNGLVDLYSDGLHFGCEGLVADAGGNTVVARVAWADEQLPPVNTQTRLQRFDTNGGVDSNFGDGAGTIHLAVSPDPIEGTIQLASQPDGKLIVATAVRPTAFLVARLLEDGRPDPSFGSDGIARLNLLEGGDNANAYAYAEALFVDPEGRIVVAGGAGIDHEKIVAARLLADGRPDMQFGERGRMSVSLADDSYAKVAIPLHDGRILLAGNRCRRSTALGRGGCDIALARLGDDGTIDSSYGDQGIRSVALSPVDGGMDLISAGARRRETGQILLVGSVSGGDSLRSGLVLQLDADGVPDEAFAPQGARIMPPLAGENRSDYLRGITFDTDRAIVLGTSFGNGTMDLSRDFVIALEADVPPRPHSTHGRPGPAPPLPGIPANRLR